MSRYIVIFITAGSAEEAEKLGQGLVENRLTACANIVPSIRSIYVWEGKICDEKEVLLIAKSKEDLFKEIVEWVKKNHSYKVPEIIALPILSGSEDYLNWIDEVCKSAD